MSPHAKKYKRRTRRGHAAGALTPMTAEDRTALKRPNQGSFTVESDRHFMRNLEAVAQAITGQMERGVESMKLHSPEKRADASVPAEA